MTSLLRILIALMLLPVVWGCLMSLLDTVSRASASATAVVLSLTTGACLMFVVLAFTRPHRLYVLGHELTHALWALLTGRRVHSIQVNRRSGSTTVSRSGLMLRLAPFLFPFYTLVLAGVYAIVSLFADQSNVLLIWLAGFGATWAFHAAFTMDALTRPQSDIRRSGWLLSMVLILWANILVVACGLCAATPATARSYIRHAVDHTVRCVQSCISISIGA